MANLPDPEFRPGDRVTTPLGDGCVTYVRFSVPDFVRIDQVSVKLDSEAKRPRYVGTIFKAGEVTKL